MLLGLGVPVYSSGAKYFVCAAEIVLSGKGSVYKPFKEIYPLIARRYNVSVENVYSSMRYALKRARYGRENACCFKSSAELISLLCR